MGKVLYIMRGPSGSGKSTWVRNHILDAHIVSADQFWLVMNASGEPDYVFNISRLAEAHQDCFCRFLDAVYSGVDYIAVDNTNIQKWQYAHYVKVAKREGYTVRIVEFRPETVSDIKVCIKRNIHEVPSETVVKMCLSFEPEDEPYLTPPISS